MMVKQAMIHVHPLPLFGHTRRQTMQSELPRPMHPARLPLNLHDWGRTSPMLSLIYREIYSHLPRKSEKKPQKSATRPALFDQGQLRQRTGTFRSGQIKPEVAARLAGKASPNGQTQAEVSFRESIRLLSGITRRNAAVVRRGPATG